MIDRMSTGRRAALVMAALGLGLGTRSVLGQAPSFTPLTPPAGFAVSSAAAVSHDGLIVAGSIATSGSAPAVPARWAAASGWAQLFTPPLAGHNFSTDMSADGSVLVGTSRFVWTPADGGRILSDLPSAARITAISADASVIVGSTTFGANAFAPFYYDLQLGPRSAPSLITFPMGLSADGSVVIGASRDIQTTRNHAARAVVGVSSQLLGPLPGGEAESTAYEVNLDGSVVTGELQLPNNAYHLFRWSAVAGMVDIWAPATWTHVIPAGISSDGLVIALNTGTSWIWDTVHGARDLKSLLVDAGVPGLTGWTLGGVRAMSPDGRFAAGDGTSPTGQGVAWVAVLPPPCLGDFNGDHAATPADVAAVVNAWVVDLSAGTLATDFDRSGAVTPSDLALFVSLWLRTAQEGC